MRRSVLVLLTVALIPLVAFTAPPSAHAQSDGNGLEESSINTFQIDESTGNVRVTVEIRLRNVTSDRREGNVIQQTFFNAYGTVVPAGAENIVATRNGSTLDGELIVEEEGEAFSLYQFQLGTRLFNGQSTTVVVTYDHTGQPPRSELLWRSNAAYASFLAFGLGDSGNVTINLVLPFGYEFDDFTDLSGFDASEPNEFAATTWTRSGLSEDFETLVSLSNDALLTTTPLEVPGADLDLRSWPDDPEWLKFAKESVETGVPELEELIGLPWPLDGQFDIRQTVEPNFYGYAGWFDSEAAEIAVGEELDADTMYHELSHAWFNSDLFEGRWLGEGFAQIYAAELVDRDGGDPRSPDVPARFGTGGQPLSEWTAFGDNGTATFEAIEDYGYNASFWVADQIADEIGLDGLARVIASADQNLLAYQVDGSTDRRKASEPATWRHVLDYVEVAGGATGVESLFRDFVVDPDRFDELDERQAAIESYHELVNRSGDWPAPVGIRTRLDIWSFERATDLITEAQATLDSRDDLMMLSEQIGVAPDGANRFPELFADANDDFDDVNEALGTEIAQGNIVADLQRAIVAQGDAADATPPRLASLDAVDGFDAAAEAADDQIDVLDALIDAIAADAEPRSFVEDIGLYGTDVDGDLEAARTAIEVGDNGAAQASLSQALETLDEADGLGSSRLTKAIAALAALLVLLIVLAVQRRKRRRAVDNAAENESGGGAVSGVLACEIGDGEIDLDKDALAGAGLSGVHNVSDVAAGDPGEAARTAGIVERGTVLSDVGDAVLELDEDVGAVVNADSVAGAEVLVDPDTHDGAER